jgi:hypothetical protein
VKVALEPTVSKDYISRPVFSIQAFWSIKRANTISQTTPLSCISLRSKIILIPSLQVVNCPMDPRTPSLCIFRPRRD